MTTFRPAAELPELLLFADSRAFSLGLQVYRHPSDRVGRQPLLLKAADAGRPRQPAGRHPAQPEVEQEGSLQVAAVAGPLPEQLLRWVGCFIV